MAEGPRLVTVLPAAGGQQLLWLGGGLLLTGALATLLVLTQAVAVGATSALSVSVLAFVKDVLQVGLAAWALGEGLTPRAAVGTSLVMCSSLVYGVLRARAASVSPQPAGGDAEEGRDEEKGQLLEKGREFGGKAALSN